MNKGVQQLVLFCFFFTSSVFIFVGPCQGQQKGEVILNRHIIKKSFIFKS